MSINRLGIVAALVAAMPAVAQKVELGGGRAGSLYKGNSVTGFVSSATTGFENQFAVTGFLGHNSYRLVGGEIRYTWERNNLKVSSGGAGATFGGESHAVHYDFVLHTAPRGAKVRPFVAGGGGVKLYVGSGTEVLAQPLGNIALLTKTRELKGLISVGGGVKAALAPHLALRIEARDYITPFPLKVIAPVGTAKIQGWVHNVTPMVSLAFTF